MCDLNKLLYDAIARDDEVAVHFLLRHGADPNARVDAISEDPLQRYGGPRSQEMRQMLESLSVEINSEPSSVAPRRRANTISGGLTNENQIMAGSRMSIDDEEVNKDSPEADEKRGRSFSFFGGTSSSSSRKICNNDNKLNMSIDDDRSKYSTWDVNRYRKTATREYKTKKKQQNKSKTIDGQILNKSMVKEDEEEQQLVKRGRSLTFGLYDAWIGWRSLLLQQLSIKKEDLSKPTPMHRAAASGNCRIISQLVLYGGDVNSELDGIYAPLDIAVLYGRRDAVSMLIDMGARVNARLETGRTALYHAAKAQQPAVMKMLLERGADASSRTAKGSTPLHLAAARDCPEAVELLLQTTACDPNARTVEGLTPLHCAAVRGGTEVLETLVERGADPGAVLKSNGKIDVSPLRFDKEDEQARVAAVLGKYASKPGLCRKLLRKVWARFARGDYGPMYTLGAVYPNRQK